MIGFQVLSNGYTYRRWSVEVKDYANIELIELYFTKLFSFPTFGSGWVGKTKNGL